MAQQIRFVTKLWVMWACLAAVGILTACSQETTPAPPTLSPLEAQGQQVFWSECTSCHADSGETVIVGPSLAGIATRAGTRVAGLDAKTYIEQSILRPDAYLVEGFAEAMPADFGKKISSESFDALVAYLLTLRE